VAQKQQGRFIKHCHVCINYIYIYIYIYYSALYPRIVSVYIYYKCTMINLQLLHSTKRALPSPIGEREHITVRFIIYRSMCVCVLYIYIYIYEIMQYILIFNSAISICEEFIYRFIFRVLKLK